MSDIRLSIITPVHLWCEKRKEDFERCLKSVEKQTYNHIHFEHIIVNDGSVIPFEFKTKPWQKVINQPHHERIIAYNNGLELAQGEIICFLDSDDEYDPKYLERVNWMFEVYPKYKMFNFGAKFVHKDGKVTERASFKLKELEVGHEMFGPGNIVNGTFVFHREIYDKLGGFPKSEVMRDPRDGFDKWLEMVNPWDFSLYAQEEFPEIKKYFMVKHPDHPALYPRELGNPFGNDFYLFYKYTRKYHSKPIDEYLYIVYPK